MTPPAGTDYLLLLLAFVFAGLCFYMAPLDADWRAVVRFAGGSLFLAFFVKEGIDIIHRRALAR